MVDGGEVGEQNGQRPMTEGVLTVSILFCFALCLRCLWGVHSSYSFKLCFVSLPCGASLSHFFKYLFMNYFVIISFIIVRTNYKKIVSFFDFL